jgi:hypothetical protein
VSPKIHEEKRPIPTFGTRRQKNPKGCIVGIYG